MIKLFNTLSRKKEDFTPSPSVSPPRAGGESFASKGIVKMYYCGPTVYWTQHIGNLRGSFCADLVKRLMEYNDYQVQFVRNYTDVGHLTSDEDSGEDKMAKGAKREGLTPQQIAQKYIDIYENDTRELNISEPTFKPKATEHVKEMIEMVKTLLDKGLAYSTDLAIYFDVSQAKDYTRLSKQKLEDNLSGAGKGEIEDPAKKNPHDFALWFFKAGAHQNALQFWPSPFTSPLVKNGEGFPGWHIECSAMSKKYLGPTLDIHMGGIEHIPVHHTNEIAQSEGANGVKYVNYWLHNEHLLVNNEKMSKSQGTGYSLQEIKDKGFDPLDLRYFYLQAHYRSKQNFTWEALAGAKNGLEHLNNQVFELTQGNPAFAKATAGTGRISKEFKDKFLEVINDDLNTPKALAVVSSLLKNKKISSADKLATIIDFDRFLGLDLAQAGKEKLAVPAEILDLVKQREDARKNKDFKKSDELRDLIKSKGYLVEDTASGNSIKKI